MLCVLPGKAPRRACCLERPMPLAYDPMGGQAQVLHASRGEHTERPRQGFPLGRWRPARRDRDPPTPSTVCERGLGGSSAPPKARRRGAGYDGWCRLWVQGWTHVLTAQIRHGCWASHPLYFRQGVVEAMAYLRTPASLVASTNNLAFDMMERQRAIGTQQHIEMFGPLHTTHYLHDKMIFWFTGCCYKYFVTCSPPSWQHEAPSLSPTYLIP